MVLEWEGCKSGGWSEGELVWLVSVKIIIFVVSGGNGNFMIIVCLFVGVRFINSF